MSGALVAVSVPEMRGFLQDNTEWAHQRLRCLIDRPKERLRKRSMQLLPHEAGPSAPLRAASEWVLRDYVLWRRYGKPRIPNSAIHRFYEWIDQEFSQP